MLDDSAGAPRIWLNQPVKQAKGQGTQYALWYCCYYYFYEPDTSYCKAKASLLTPPLYRVPLLASQS